MEEGNNYSRNIIVFGIYPCGCDDDLDEITKGVKSIDIPGITWCEEDEKIKYIFQMYSLKILCIVDKTVETYVIEDRILEVDGVKRVEVSEIKNYKNYMIGWHGTLFSPVWRLPKCVARTQNIVRIDQGNTINASEFVDHPEVMSEKMRIVADFLQKSRYCIVYTGAGISRPAGIADMASTAENSVTNQVKKIDKPALAEPTYSHHVIANLEERGLIQKYIQQNHDGLPQKAGFPQEKMNEIHGSLFDPSNPVVKFSKDLRKDLEDEMKIIEKKADFCLCMGTSLSGMNSDRCVWTPGEKFNRKTEGIYGSVLINLQKTPLDFFQGFQPIRVWENVMMRRNI